MKVSMAKRTPKSAAKQATTLRYDDARRKNLPTAEYEPLMLEIRKFVWTEGQPQRTQRTQSVAGFLFSALSAFFAVK